MSKAMSTLTVQVPARVVREAIPAKLSIGTSTIEIGPAAAAETTVLGLEGHRFPARWTKRGAAGAGSIEVRPSSKLTSEITVVLEAPRGVVWKLLGNGQGLRSLAQLYARALRYEVETKGDEQADAFSARRTTPELVKARTA
ncbi:MAG TPA: hypothetical protein VFA34_04715 [Actinomycetota bacterium]|jgi:hypothetical protein|nr:hypothetical protein [Actinomycetota bacterium]